MKKTLSMLLSAVFLLLASASMDRASAAAKEVVDVAVLNFPPYFIAGSDKDHKGVAVDIITAAFDRADLEARFVVLPYTRSIRVVESGRYHVVGILNAATSDKLLLSSDHTFALQQAFFVRHQSTWRYDGIESLDTLKVVTVNSYDYSQISPAYQRYLETAGNVVKISPDATYQARIARMIAGGRVDVFNEDRGSMNYAIEQAGLKGKLKEAGILPGMGKQYLGFSPTETGRDLRKKFDAAFAELLASGPSTGSWRSGISGAEHLASIDHEGASAMDVRKTLQIVETITADGFGTPCDPITRVAALAVVRNPLAGGFVEDLSALFDIGGALGERLMGEAVARLTGPPVSYGKAAIVGLAGDLEHGGAMIHPKLGKPMRAAVGGGQALIPSNAKVAAAGVPIDLPLGHKDEAWSFDHFDTMTVMVGDAPRPDEIVLCMAVTDGARPHPRVGKGPITD